MYNSTIPTMCEPPDQFPQYSWCCFHIMEHDKTFTSARVRDESASHAQETAWISGRKTGQKTGVCIIHQAIQTDLPSLDLNCQAALAPVWFERTLIRQGSRIFCSTHDLLWTSGCPGHRLLPGISNQSYMWAYGREQTPVCSFLWAPKSVGLIGSSKSIGGCSFISSAQVDAGSTFVVHFTETQL